MDNSTYTPVRQNVQYPTVAYVRKGKPKIKVAKKDGGTYEALAPHSDLKNKFRIHFLPGTSKARAVWHVAHAGELVIYPENSTTLEGYEVEQLRVIVPARKVWNAWRYGNTANNTGREIARADDERYWTLRDPLNGKYIVRDGEPYKKFSVGDAIHYERDGRQFEIKLKTSGQLRLVAADMVEQGQLVEFVLKTTSFYDCQNIRAQLEGIQNIADSIGGGNAAGIPLIIYRVPQEVTWNKPDGGASRVSQWIVNIQADPEWVKFAFAKLGRLALSGGEAAYLPPPSAITGPIAPEEDDDSDVVDNGDEFELQNGPEWEEKVVEQNQSELPAETPALPSSAEALRKIFAKEYNAAIKVVSAKNLPKISGDSKPEQIKEAIAGVRAAVAAKS